ITTRKTMILSVFITVITGHDKPQPPGCLLDYAFDMSGNYFSNIRFYIIGHQFPYTSKAITTK
ncbi:TPA: hypothetical protein ACIY9L_004789, partial [Escherichia coli]